MTIITVCRIIHTAVSLCGCLVLLVVLHSKEITFRGGAECLNGTVTPFIRLANRDRDVCIKVNGTYITS